MKKMSTGYPSIDKPWLKYYSEDAINTPVPEITMYQYIWECNKDHLSDLALNYYGSKITYGKLFEEIHRVASVLYSMGIRKGDVVTVMSMHTPETIICIYALNYIGATANMVYMTLSSKEIANTIKETKSKMLFVLDVALDRINETKDNISIPVIVLEIARSMPSLVKFGCRLKSKTIKHNYIKWTDFVKAQYDGTVPMANDHTATAVIVYTSGTTGVPKGVELTNYNLNAVAFQYYHADLNICRGDTILVFMPPFLSIGLCYLHQPLTHGEVLIICANPDPEVVVKEYIKQKPNHFITAPSMILQIIDSGLNDYSFVKTFAAGGDSMSIEDERRINRCLKKGGSKVKYITGYGMTEFSSSVITNCNNANKEGTLGIPLVKCNVKVIDPDSHEEKHINETGELLINTPSQMRGYMNNDIENKTIIEDFGDGIKWIHTGDLGFVDEDGFVHYIGRIKRIYLTKVIGGDGTLYKIFPQRIEECAEALNVVSQCGVVVKKDSDRLHIPEAFITLNDNNIDKESVISEIKNLFSNELPSHSQPEEIHIIDRMPLTPSNKIDYRALEQLIEKKSHSKR